MRSKQKTDKYLYIELGYGQASIACMRGESENTIRSEFNRVLKECSEGKTYIILADGHAVLTKWISEVFIRG